MVNFSGWYGDTLWNPARGGGMWWQSSRQCWGCKNPRCARLTVFLSNRLILRGNQKSRVLKKGPKRIFMCFLRHFSQSFPLIFRKDSDSSCLTRAPRDTAQHWPLSQATPKGVGSKMEGWRIPDEENAMGAPPKCATERCSGLRFQGSKCYHWPPNVSFLEMMLLHSHTLRSFSKSVLRVRRVHLNGSPP